MLMEIQDFPNALVAYEANLKRHPGRFNALYGAAIEASKSGEVEKAKEYFRQLITTTQLSDKKRPELIRAELFLR
jgi:predicted Zn-dependent protease